MRRFQAAAPQSDTDQASTAQEKAVHRIDAPGLQSSASNRLDAGLTNANQILL